MAEFQLHVSQGTLEDERGFKDAIARGAQHFRESGYLEISNLLPQELVRDLYRELLLVLEYRTDDMCIGRGALVGNRRYSVSIPIRSVFADTRVFANPVLLLLMDALLSGRFVINSFGAVVSLPGSEQQQIHKDAADLFEDEPTLTSAAPPYAITVSIPLVDTTTINGPTIIQPRSHRMSSAWTPSPDLLRSFPCTAGSALLWDYRIYHGGAPNRSTEIRPLLYIVYSRPWFYDHANFSRKAAGPVQIDRETRDGLGAELKRLFVA